jgi:hypothetical protein
MGTSELEYLPSTRAVVPENPLSFSTVHSFEQTAEISREIEVSTPRKRMLCDVYAHVPQGAVSKLSARSRVMPCTGSCLGQLQANSGSSV